MLFLSLVRDQEVDGSNPFAPTIFSASDFLISLLVSDSVRSSTWRIIRAK
jgi:hypothetical protein